MLVYWDGVRLTTPSPSSPYHQSCEKWTNQFLGFSTLPTRTEKADDFIKAALVEGGRTPNTFGKEVVCSQFCSARSQVRECCHLETPKLYGGGTGVRVGHRPPWCPEGTYVPKKGECFKSEEGQAGIRKRSYRRAMHRLGALGFAKYRGRMLHRTQSFDFISASKQTLSPGYKTAGQRQGQGTGWTVGSTRRLQYAVWNCGGLSAQLYAEVLCWAKKEEIDVLLLPETHWGSSMEWQDEDWCCVHSAAIRSRTGGVMVLASRKRVDVATLRWSEAYRAGMRFSLLGASTPVFLGRLG